MNGAWVVVVAVPLLMLLFSRIHSYYAYCAIELELGSIPTGPDRAADA